MKVLLINGSPKAKGNTALALGEMAKVFGEEGFEVETVHVKNTGRCRELLLPRATVVLARAENPNRKTRYDLISVRKPGLGWVNIDSQACNKVAAEWLAEGPGPFADVRVVRPEFTYGDSRFDFYLEAENRKILMEVKGCTLERGGVGFFPDAPTERGVKHLRGLAKAAGEGYESFLAFVIAMPGVKRVLPNVQTHPAFAEALADAVSAGVRVLYLTCTVAPDELTSVKCMEEKDFGQ